VLFSGQVEITRQYPHKRMKEIEEEIKNLGKKIADGIISKNNDSDTKKREVKIKIAKSINSSYVKRPKTANFTMNLIKPKSPSPLEATTSPQPTVSQQPSLNHSLYTQTHNLHSVIPSATVPVPPQSPHSLLLSPINLFGDSHLFTRGEHRTETATCMHDGTTVYFLPTALLERIENYFPSCMQRGLEDYVRREKLWESVLELQESRKKRHNDVDQLLKNHLFEKRGIPVHSIPKQEIKDQATINSYLADQYSYSTLPNLKPWEKDFQNLLGRTAASQTYASYFHDYLYLSPIPLTTKIDAKVIKALNKQNPPKSSVIHSPSRRPVPSPLHSNTSSQCTLVHSVTSNYLSNPLLPMPLEASVDTMIRIHSKEYNMIHKISVNTRRGDSRRKLGLEQWIEKKKREQNESEQKIALDNSEKDRKKLVILPADGQSGDYAQALDNLTRNVSTSRDQPKGGMSSSGSFGPFRKKSKSWRALSNLVTSSAKRNSTSESTLFPTSPRSNSIILYPATAHPSPPNLSITIRPESRRERYLQRGYKSKGIRLD